MAALVTMDFNSIDLTAGSGGFLGGFSQTQITGDIPDIYLNIEKKTGWMDLTGNRD